MNHEEYFFAGDIDKTHDLTDRIPASWHYNNDRNDTDRNLNDEEETTVSDEESEETGDVPATRRTRKIL